MDSAVLSLTCAGLGASQEDEDGAVIGYAKSDHCLDNLKDLQRFLRRDDPQRREVFKQVCKWKIASRDLVPIIENYQNDRNLVITAVKVLVFLTMPVESSSDDVAQQIEYLWDLKAALTRNVAVTVIVSLLEDPLDRLERTLFSEDDWKLVQLVLTLFRNVLAIQEITLTQKASGEATHLLFLADSFLELMFQENVMDIILVLTQHIDEPSGYLKEENLLLMEIYHYLFLGRDPGLIARASNKGSKDQVNGDIVSSVDSLRLMMEEEERKKRMFRQRNSEHSSLNGTFTCFSVDGSKSLCKGNPSSSSANSLLKIRNVQRGPQKRIAWDNELLYIPKEGITEMLRSFMDQFLSGAYNILMQSVCDDIMDEHHSIEKSDIITFFKVARFVLAFQHEKASNDQKSVKGIQPSEVSPSNEHDDNLPFHGDICGPVAATLNEDMFNIVISRWRETYEGLKETNDYKTLSAAGSLMKNMIDMIYLVLKVLPEDSRESQTARVLLYKLFYDQTENGLTQFLLNLFRSFDSHKQPKSDLVDLLETIHIMLQLMEKLQARGTLRVAKKTKKVRRKKATNGKNENSEPKVENVEPNDAHPTDETKCSPESLPDLRIEGPASEPSPSEPGKVDTSGAPVPDILVDTAVNMESTAHAEGGPSCTDGGVMKNLIDEEGETSDSSVDHQPATSEVDFNVSRLISSLANNSVVQNICWLLKHYKSNSYRTNHYIICMLRRFCEDLELSPMLYQLSLLTTFYDILAEEKSSSSKEYTNIVNFLSKVVRKMLRSIKKQPLLFVDILFWKTRKECHCIDADLLLNELKKDAGNKDGEIGSSKGWRGPVNIADSLGDDEVDLVIPQAPYDADKDGDLSADEHGDDFRKSSTTYKRSRFMSLSDSDAEENERNHVSRDSVPKVPKRRGRSLFTEEQERLIRDLYEKYKDDRKCSHLIADALDSSGKITSAQVSRKLTQLGLRNVTRRKKGADESLLTGDRATEPQNNSLDDLNSMLAEHNHGPKSKSSRARRKRLNVSSDGHDDTSHGRSSDEETLQVLKSRTKNKKVPLVDSSLSAPQHQEAQHDPDSDDATIGSMIRSRKKKRLSTSDFEGNVQNHQESSDNTNTKDCSPTISQHEKILLDTYSDDETIGSIFRSGKKKRLVTSNFSANIEDQESLRNIKLHDETVASNITDVSVNHGSDPVHNSGNNVEAELLDDFEVELDNHENTDQRITDDGNMTESGDTTNSDANRRAGLKRRHRLVIDDDDEDD
ncbi:protein timeless homolog isoform X1 [Sorghum bicolor]|nr:protein timeless homolog isoform X1 [Sorghum bicolor]|eukprot:XP_021303359.1 protein timeless homolog isoform X1 [Sorghum bicolor]